MENLNNLTLAGFIGRSLELLHPGTHFTPNWHIDLIAEYLNACADGQINRLIINLPPRSLKSHAVSVAWPAWLLGKNPGQKIIVASYSSALALKHSMDCRALMQSEWYKDLFREVAISREQNEKRKFMTTERGFRLATSTGGTLTGEGGRFLIADDPSNGSQMSSRRMRERAVEWFRHTFMTRQDDPANGAYIIVMQRLHPEDLTGALLSSESGKLWEHLVIPAVETERRVYQCGRVSYERAQGELLNPDRMGLEDMERLKLDLGSHVFAAQYQQAPVSIRGRLILPAWLGRFTEAPQGTVVQSWDTAVKATEANDYSVCLSWVVAADGYYLTHIWREAVEYPRLKSQLLEMAEQQQPDTIIIEDTATGQALIQELRTRTRLPVIGMRPKGDKLTRLMRVHGLFEAGKVKLPESAPWLADYLNELTAFPEGKHDDMVDATTQFLEWAKSRDHFAETSRIRTL